jgi:hypothetical protein
MEIVCDASELVRIYSKESPDTFVVAGYSVPSQQLPSLIRGAEGIKKGFLGDFNAPIKWNVKDLKRALELQGLANLLPKILEKSDDIRNALLESLCRSGATLFVSVIQAYSANKQVLGKTKDDVIRYAFGNFASSIAFLSASKRRSGAGLTKPSGISFACSGEKSMVAENACNIRRTTIISFARNIVSFSVPFDLIEQVPQYPHAWRPIGFDTTRQHRKWMRIAPNGRQTKHFASTKVVPVPQNGSSSSIPEESANRSIYFRTRCGGYD